MMPRTFASLAVLLIAPALVSAQESYKVEPLAESAPADVAGPIRSELEAQGYRILQPDGQPLADLWVRKVVPATGAYAGPAGAVQFPVVAEGELLGAVRYAAEGHDYRDQAILPGVYTLRFGLHPVNGDHLGVSPFRDFAMVLPVASDQTVAAPDRKAIEAASAEAAGTNHPAILLLRALKGEAKAGSARHDEGADLWGLVLPMNLAPAGGEAKTLPVELIFEGAAAQ